MIEITGRTFGCSFVSLMMAMFALSSTPSASGFPSFTVETASNANLADAGSTVLNAANPFSLTETFVLQLTKGDSVQVPGALTIPPADALIAPVSETGSTLAFLGLALLGLEVVRRRLRAA